MSVLISRIDLIVLCIDYCKTWSLRCRHNTLIGLYEKEYQLLGMKFQHLFSLKKKHHHIKIVTGNSIHI